MATTGDGPNKSAFLRDLFGKNPGLKLDEATGAWQKAGNEGEIGSSLYYNIKRGLGGKTTGGVGNGGAAPRKPKSKAAFKGPKGKRATPAAGETRPASNGATAPRPASGRSGAGERERVLDRVEDGIDDLIIELKQLGGMKEALEGLRKVRRVVVRSHGG
jgi:hypothetical protein